MEGILHGHGHNAAPDERLDVVVDCSGNTLPLLRRLGGDDPDFDPDYPFQMDKNAFFQCMDAAFSAFLGGAFDPSNVEQEQFRRFLFAGAKPCDCGGGHLLLTKEHAFVLTGGRICESTTASPPCSTT